MRSARRAIALGLLCLSVVIATGCALSGKGNFPYPVWIWECGDKPDDERC